MLFKKHGHIKLIKNALEEIWVWGPIIFECIRVVVDDFFNMISLVKFLNKNIDVKNIFLDFATINVKFSN